MNGATTSGGYTMLLGCHTVFTSVNAAMRVLGFDLTETSGTSSRAESALDALVQTMISQRAQARAEKDWGAADRIREAIAAAGIVLEDTADGTHWSIND